ncbi:MAG TPA: chemotaxis protein CheB [Chloroflexota bacterium]
MRLNQSPAEHHFRPAIDPLFRTAACAYGQRVVGVVLSGRNADGTAGLLNVVLRGRLALVQDPDEAEHAEMPTSALANVPGAGRLRMADIASVILGLTVASRQATRPPPDVVSFYNLRGVRTLMTSSVRLRQPSFARMWAT